MRNAGSEGDRATFRLSYQDPDSDTPETVLWIYANGSVLVSDTHSVGARRGQLTPEQLNDLVDDIVVGASVFDLDSNRILADVRAAAAQSGREWRVSNPTLMKVQVRWHGREHDIECPSVDVWHERFPDVESVAKLCFVRQRLENVRAIVQVGGWEIAESLSAIANRELLRLHPDAPAVTPKNLSMVRGSSEDLRYVQFVTPASTSGGETLMISVFQFPNRPARVTISPLSGS